MTHRRTVLVAAAAAAVLATALRWSVTRRPDAPAPAEAPGALPAPAGAVVVSADPLVERSGTAGRWIAARPGDPLGPADAIRTARGTTAEVSLGRGARLVIDERSEVRFRELGAAAQRIRLVRGRIGLDDPGDGARALHVEDGSGTIRASSRGGRWSAVASHGALAVASAEGTVRLESAGAGVDVPTGAEAAAWRGAAPLAARPVSSAVLLRVAQAIAERRRTACAVLQVDVASEVEVNGEVAPIGRDGLVVVRVPDRRRRLGADVVVRHVTGAVERRHVGCVDVEVELKGWEVRWNSP